MKNIFLLSESQSQNSKAFLKPLCCFSQQLKMHKIRITRIPYRIPYVFQYADEVWINSKNFRHDWVVAEKKIFGFLDYLVKKNIPIKFFDTTDSGGMIQRRIMPYVKYYYKPFLYTDRKIYSKKLYGSRLFTDFYHEKENIIDPADPTDDFYNQLSPNELQKLKICWGPSASFYESQENNHHNIVNLKVKTELLTARFQTHYKRPTISYQRLKSVEILNSHGINCSKIDKTKYLQELHQAKASFSPFGWGEFAYRDYEVFLNYTLLIKPDMEPIECWPPIYENHKTYLPIKWDLSNLGGTIIDLKSRPEHYQSIAETGHNHFKKQHLGEFAREIFWQKILSIVND